MSTGIQKKKKPIKESITGHEGKKATLTRTHRQDPNKEHFIVYTDFVLNALTSIDLIL